jgi:hypothetical protein
MSYEVRCECGKAHVVSNADAGSVLHCACGRNVEVPALHVLRASVGVDKLSPAFRLEGLLFNRKLPGTRCCGGCKRETDGLIQVSIVCERGSSGPDESQRDTDAEKAEGCVLALFGFYRLRREGHRPGRKQGQDVTFTVPLPVCERCDPRMDHPGTLCPALRTIRVYADVLDQYPKAEVSRTG